MSKKDINIREGFPNKDNKERDSISYYSDSNSNIIINSQTENMSVIKGLEGPHKIKDSNVNKMFFN